MALPDVRPRFPEPLFRRIERYVRDVGNWKDATDFIIDSARRRYDELHGAEPDEIGREEVEA